MSDKPKSILDNMTVKEEGFPLSNSDSVRSGIASQEYLHVVGHCPQCGAPIYGPVTVGPDTGNIPVRKTCNCVNQIQSFQSNIQHK